MRFLNVLQASDAGAAPAAVASINANPASWAGAQVAASVVMFPVNIGQAFQGLSYAVTATASRHVITGLPPNTGFSVQRNGNSVTIQAGGNQMSDSGGVLQLR